jgi:4-amino-4-deoxy-L-arabinose transferase-like glycosyltransferase
MAYWPKTIRGNVLTVMLIVVGLPIAVIAAIALSGPLVWGGLAFVALASVALYFWRRTVERARERAWVGAFSFGDMVASMKARQAVDDPVRGRIPVVESSGRRPELQRR